MSMTVADSTFDEYSLSWDGRQLAQIVHYTGYVGEDGEYNDTYLYTYNADGIRTSKTVGNIKYEYILSGSTVVGMRWTQNSIEHIIEYLYDESGAPIGLKYRTGAYAYNQYDCYFFEKNLHGDIIAIYNESGTKIGTYTYDAWGNVTVSVTSGNTTLENNIVRKYNAFRYRGYYYDIETGWYYLQSRYYNPNWGRFINADASLYGHVLGYNLFAYCANNPIVHIDSTGHWLVVDDIFTGPVDEFIVLGILFVGSVIGIGVADELTESLVEGIQDIYEGVHDIFSSNPPTISPKEHIDETDSFNSDEEYDPDPYKRPGRKKQGRETSNKARQKNWKPRNNRRDNKPAKPKKHTPGKEHRKYYEIITGIPEKIVVFN